MLRSARLPGFRLGSFYPTTIFIVKTFGINDTAETSENQLFYTPVQYCFVSFGSLNL